MILRELPVSIFVGALIAMFSLIPAQAESLQQAFQSALLENPDIAVADIEALMAAEDVAITIGRQMPQIEGSVVGAVSRIGEPGGLTDTASLRAGISLDYTIFDGFRGDAQVEAAEANRDAREHLARATQQQVLLAVAQVYFDVGHDEEIFQLMTKSETSLQALLDWTREQEMAGDATRVEVVQALGRVQQSSIRRRQAEIALAISRTRYSRLVGHMPSGVRADAGSIWPTLPRTLEEALAQASIGNPSVLSAQAQRRAAAAGYDEAQGAQAPVVGLQVSGCYFQCNGVATETSWSARAEVSIKVPLYTGGVIDAEIRKANLGVMRSDALLRRTFDDVDEAVVQAWYDAADSFSAISSVRDIVASRTEALELIVRLREAGEVTTMDVLESQLNLTESQQSLVDLRRQYNGAAASLASVIGILGGPASTGSTAFQLPVAAADQIVIR